MILSHGPRLLALLALYHLAACQMTQPAVPAVMTDTSETSMAALKSTLGTAMQTASVNLGPGDLTQTSTITVLPPRPGPLEGNSPALPVQFTLMIENGDCILVRADTGESYAHSAVPCKPATQ